MKGTRHVLTSPLAPGTRLVPRFCPELPYLRVTIRAPVTVVIGAPGGRGGWGGGQRMSILFAGLHLVTMYYKMEQGKACAADGRNRGSTCFSNLESRSKVKGACDTSEASPQQVGEHWHPEASWRLSCLRIDLKSESWVWRVGKLKEKGVPLTRQKGCITCRPLRSSMTQFCAYWH